MKQAMSILLFLLPCLLVGCIQEAKWSWTGDVLGGDVAADRVVADGEGEISPSDASRGEDFDAWTQSETIDSIVPEDTTDTQGPPDTVDTVAPQDLCVPDCEGKVCGDDGCGGTCGSCDDGDPCTEDVCVSGECNNPKKDIAGLLIEDCLCEDDEGCDFLDDDDPCNGTLVCDTDADIPTCMVDEETVITCTLPEGLAPECNASFCASGFGDCAVGNINEGGPCDDGEDCTWQDQCSEGSCVGIWYECDDPGQCEIADGATCNGDGTCAYPPAPQEIEICDGQDNDCDGETDEGFPDTDDDGLKDCVDDDDDNDGAPDEDDCAPLDSSVYAGATEICNAIDDDCDGSIDEDSGTEPCGQGICAHEMDICVGGVLQVCDPFEGAGPEVCDGDDNDCDGETDEGFPDTDDDGLKDCLDDDDDGDGTLDDSDCAPLNPAIHIEATELCNGIDDNCDGVTDEGCP